MTWATKVGILAGGGQLPFEVAKGLAARGLPYHIVGLSGFVGSGIATHPHTLIGLGQLGRLLRTFRNEGCRDLIIIGTLARPDMTKLRLDFGAIRYAPSWLALTRGGDDSLLRKVVRFFEGQGFRVRGAGELVPELLAGEGAIAGGGLSEAQVRSIDVGRKALLELSRFDVGQALVAAPDGVVAFEDGGGTARMLQELARTGGVPPNAVLVKLAKAGQEIRVDAPTIGAETVRQASEAGVSAIAVEANSTLIAERPLLIEAAQERRLAIVGVPTAGGDHDGEPFGEGSRPGVAAELADDSTTALNIARGAALLLQPDRCDLGVVVQSGHTTAILADGLVTMQWPDRLSRLPQGWRLPFLGKRKRGAWAIVVRHWRLRNQGMAEVPAEQLVAAARAAGLAMLCLQCGNGSRVPETFIHQLEVAARLAGIRFHHIAVEPGDREVGRARQVADQRSSEA